MAGQRTDLPNGYGSPLIFVRHPGTRKSIGELRESPGHHKSLTGLAMDLRRLCSLTTEHVGPRYGPAPVDHCVTRDTVNQPRGLQARLWVAIAPMALEVLGTAGTTDDNRLETDDVKKAA